MIDNLHCTSSLHLIQSKEDILASVSKANVKTGTKKVYCPVCLRSGCIIDVRVAGCSGASRLRGDPIAPHLFVLRGSFNQTHHFITRSHTELDPQSAQRLRCSTWSCYSVEISSHDSATAEARANVETFIAWSRELGLRDPDIFEVDDLAKVHVLLPSFNDLICHDACCSLRTSATSSLGLLSSFGE